MPANQALDGHAKGRSVADATDRCGRRPLDRDSGVRRNELAGSHALRQTVDGLDVRRRGCTVLPLDGSVVYLRRLHRID